ncbi:hypothetical protein [Euzebya tangerina]|uniref:hypothetical protein n=1 Tax=Euzebya tangerina TaxID=591198 RepID=UPI000E321422|nr:hypothetical protein [Euzebya tangerina]
MPTVARRANPADGGAAGLLTILTTLISGTVVVAVVLSLATAAAAAGRARAAADAAALAILSGSPLAGGDGSPARDAGEIVARAADVTIVSLDQADWPLAVHVVTEIDVPLIPWMPRVLQARGSAALDPPDPP